MDSMKVTIREEFVLEKFDGDPVPGAEPVERIQGGSAHKVNAEEILPPGNSPREADTELLRLLRDKLLEVKEKLNHAHD